jgi:hypothetical protein
MTADTSDFATPSESDREDRYCSEIEKRKKITAELHNRCLIEKYFGERFCTTRWSFLGLRGAANDRKPNYIKVVHYTPFIMC